MEWEANIIIGHAPLFQIKARPSDHGDLYTLSERRDDWDYDSKVDSRSRTLHVMRRATSEGYVSAKACDCFSVDKAVIIDCNFTINSPVSKPCGSSCAWVSEITYK